MNVGERGELLIKMKLTEMRDKNGYFNGELIVSVGFDQENNLSPPDEYYELGEFDYNNDFFDKDILKIAKKMEICKAKVFDKSDVHVNKSGYSLKSTSGANSALINHTNRVGFERVCNELNVDISTLDKIIETYWNLRLNGIIGEDISNDDPRSPFKDHKEYFRPILEYFLFTGSGSRKSQHPADFILEYSDPFDEESWEIINKHDAVDRVWPKLIFSMRSKKGMPTDYTLDYKGNGAASIAKWVRETDGSFKGSLHVRVAEKKRPSSSKQSKLL